MPLFTFNSDRSLNSWMMIVVAVVVINIGVIIGFNGYWTILGYSASVQDTKQFWAVHRASVYPKGKTALVFLGASRTLYGIDLAWVRDNLHGYKPVMLAVNGHYPLALLKDLAYDERFTGVVLVDIDSRGLSVHNHGMLQSYVDYYHQEFSPNKWLHHQVLARLQQRVVFLEKSFSLTSVLRRAMTGEAPPRKANSWMELSRNSMLDLHAVDAGALADWFAGLVQEDMRNNPPPALECWLASLGPVSRWVQKIQERGGQVVFYRPPLSGRQLSLEQQYYPREQYWDSLSSRLGWKTLLATDIPAIAEIDLPDESHMHYSEKTTYTRHLVEYIMNELLE